jgi:2-alkenal reductase
VKRRERILFMLGLTFGIVLGGLGVSRDGFGVLAQDATSRTAAQPSAVDIVEQVGPAVVTVINEQRFDENNGNQLEPAGSGTGFIIDQDGHIVTNWHVVDGGEKFEVIFADGTTKPADLVGTDQVSDLAIVQVDGELPGTVSLGDSDTLKPGQPVLAIGSPLGAFTNTVTQGIVSAIGRDFPGSETYTNLIQHDAAINPGNSGGPLFNFDGEVVGVNTLGIPQSNSGEIVQGLFFAIPSNTVKKIAAQLIEKGVVTYPYFGIEFSSVTQDVVAQNDLGVDNGVLVLTVVPGGPADQAGVKEGDVVTAIDGVAIDQQTSFSEALFEHQPGDTVTITVVRDGRELQLQITLGERPPDLN